MALLKTDPIDFKLDPLTGDLVVTTDAEFVSGPDAVAQGILVRLQTFKGEWFANLDLGVPYYEDILGQKYVEAKVRDAFIPELTSTPGVAELVRFDVNFDAGTRILRIAWEVLTAFDDTIITGELEI